MHFLMTTYRTMDMDMDMDMCMCMCMCMHERMYMCMKQVKSSSICTVWERRAERES